MQRDAMTQDHVLIVEDDEAVLLTLEQILADEGYALRCARGGEEALALLQTEPFDLILTDLRMEKVDGLDLLEVAQKLWPPPAIIIITGYASLDTAVEALRLGAHSYLMKPCNVEELKLAVRRGLEGRRFREIEVLYRIAQTLTSTLDLDSLFAEVLGAARRITQLSEAWILLKDRDAFTAPNGSPPMSDSAAAWVAELLQQPLLHDRLAAGVTVLYPGAGEPEPVLRELVERAGLRSLVIIPLLNRGKLEGLLVLRDVYRDRALLPGAIRLIQGLGHHASIAIAQARLLSHLEQANHELRSIDEFKSNLLSTITHELKTPMVAVKGYTKLLLKDAAGPLAPSQREYLQIALKNIDRQLLLIDGLLDYSRLERQPDPLQPSWTDMGEIVKECIQSIEPETQRKTLRLEHHADRASYPLWGDRLRLTQALSNLVANAVKFTPSGGFIRIELEQSEPSAVTVRISDNGVGIPEQIQDKIFDRFFQADSSAARRFGGVGLGLAITREIVAHHGGRISVRSQSGRGASFTLVLPTQPRERGEGPAAVPAAPAGRQDPVPS